MTQAQLSRIELKINWPNINESCFLCASASFKRYGSYRRAISKWYFFLKLLFTQIFSNQNAISHNNIDHLFGKKKIISIFLRIIILFPLLPFIVCPHLQKKKSEEKKTNKLCLMICATHKNRHDSQQQQ